MHRINCVHIKLLLLLSLLPLLVGCNEGAQKSEIDISSPPEIDTERNPLDFLFEVDTLTLSARFSECGEFGGHKERIDVFYNYSEREHFANYVIDSIDIKCPEGFEEDAIIKTDTLFKLSLENEYAIVQYLDNLYKRVLIRKPPSHANDYYSAYTQFSGLRISTAEPYKDWNEYNELVKKLIK